MADYFGAASSLFSGLGSIAGDVSSAIAGGQTADAYKEEEKYAKISGKLKDIALARQAYQLEGAAGAAIGASGFTLGGSGLDVMRSNAQQASLSQGVTDMNTRIQVASYAGMAKAAEAQSTGSWIGAGLNLLGTVASVAAFL